MTTLLYYEALKGMALDGLTDPIDLPHTIRVIARPNTKSIHPIVGDMMRSLGATRDLYSKAQGIDTLLNAASAWCLAGGVTDVYIGEAQDLDRPAILECLDFAERVGATLHLVIGFGETCLHAETLTALGGQQQPFSALPAAIREPSSHRAPTPTDERDVEDIDVPDDDWITFRPTYHALLPPATVSLCDAIYLDAYTTARASTATTEDEIASLIAQAWKRHGATRLPSTVAVRAVQAALFRNGTNVRVDLGHLERAITLRLLNPLTPAHYRDLRSYADPWRAAATVLHAQHVSTEDAVNLRAFDVTPEGTIPSLATRFHPDAHIILAAQRWSQLIASDETPPLFDKSINTMRSGIRKVVRELGLPLETTWRGLKADRWQHNYGLKATAIS